MMLQIAMAITVAFLASLATSLGLFGLDFWWELAALVVIMLLGHWMEMRALGQARGALSALAELLPDEAERLTGKDIETVPVSGQEHVQGPRLIGKHEHSAPAEHHASGDRRPGQELGELRPDASLVRVDALDLLVREHRGRPRQPADERTLPYRSAGL
jgi:ABC-type nickel/cobalt efflux system permease component RcnA